MDIFPLQHCSDQRLTLVPGTILDHRFMVLALLGRGGTGSVYKAVDLHNDVIVAVKVQDASPQNATLSDATLHRLLQHEARTLRRLRGAPVVRYHAARLDHAPRYIVTRYVPGRTLAAVLEHEHLSRSAAFRLSLAITEAVEELHAHRPQITHGDLKPANIMITPQGDVVLLDLGSARWAGMEMLDLPPMWTPAFAAPEQQMNAAIDQRTDQYALCLLIEAMIGTNEVPEAVRLVLARGTALLPQHRYRSLRAFRNALEIAIAEPDATAVAFPWWLRMLLVILALLLLRALLECVGY